MGVACPRLTWTLPTPCQVHPWWQHRGSGSSPRWLYGVFSNCLASSRSCVGTGFQGTDSRILFWQEYLIVVNRVGVTRTIATLYYTLYSSMLFLLFHPLPIHTMLLCYYLCLLYTNSMLFCFCYSTHSPLEWVWYCAISPSLHPLSTNSVLFMLLCYFTFAPSSIIIACY